MKKTIHLIPIIVLLLGSFSISNAQEDPTTKDNGFAILELLAKQISDQDDAIFKKGIGGLNKFLAPKYLNNTITIVGLTFLAPINGYHFGLLFEMTDKSQNTYERLIKLGMEDARCASLYKSKYSTDFESYQLPQEEYAVFKSNYKHWKNGTAPKDGTTKETYDNGSIQTEETWENGKRNGLHKGWYENGQLCFETSYKDGKKNGISKEWYKNGQLRSEGNYKEGKEEDGIFRSWYENGQLMYEYNFKDRKLIAKKMWDQHGKLTMDK